MHLTWWRPSFGTDRDGRLELRAPERRVAVIGADGGWDDELLAAMRQPVHLPSRPSGRRHHMGARAEMIDELGVEMVVCAAARAGARGIPVRSPEAQWVVAAEPRWPSGDGGVAELCAHGDVLTMSGIDDVGAHCACAMARAAAELARSLGHPLVMPRPRRRAAAVGLEHLGAIRLGRSHMMLV